MSGTKTVDVQYSGGATRSEAHALAAGMITLGVVGDGSRASVWLDRSGGEPVISVVLLSGAWDNPDVLEAWKEYARKLAPTVGAPLSASASLTRRPSSRHRSSCADHPRRTP